MNSSASYTLKCQILNQDSNWTLQVLGDLDRLQNMGS